MITASTPAVLRFDLSQLTPTEPSLNGVILEVSVEIFNAAGTNYKVFNPRIVGNSSPLSINGLHVYVGASTSTGMGTEDPNQGDLWSTMNAVAAPIAMPSPLPSGPMTQATPLVGTSLSIGVRTLGSDVMTSGFESIQ